MKNVMLIFSMAALLFIISGKQTVAQIKDDPKQIAELKNRIDGLEKIIDNQEKQIAKLSDEIESLKKQKPMVAFPSMPDQKGKPKNGKPFKFNGETYYIVPLQMDNKNSDEFKKMLK